MRFPEYTTEELIRIAALRVLRDHDAGNFADQQRLTWAISVASQPAPQRFIDTAPYGELLRHPKWQRRRLERLQAAGWKCSWCHDTESELHVHHERYIKGRKPWEYDDSLLSVLCVVCHAREHGIRIGEHA